MVKFLLNNKADCNIKDADGKTVLHRAAESQNGQIIEEIMKVCPDLKDEVDSKGKTALSYIQNDEFKIFLI